MPTGFTALRPDAGIIGIRILDSVIILLGILLVGPPIAGMIASGLGSLPALWDTDIGTALVTSLSIALPAALLSVTLAISLSALSCRLRLRIDRPALADMVGIAALVALVVPPLALAAGLIMAFQALNSGAFARVIVILINALLALPFAYRQIEPIMRLTAERFNRLSDSLGMSALARLRLVDGPMLRRPLIIAFAVAMALSLGDMGVATLFGGSFVTLPVLLYQFIGAYRMDEAGSLALLIGGLVFVFFLVAQSFSREPDA